MTIGYLSDSFDLLNVRDLDLIAQAGARCTHLVLGVHTDAYAAELSGRPPVVPLDERMTLLGHVRGVAEVVAHDAGSAPTADLHFVAADAPGPEDTADATSAEVLTPGRVTTSTMLQLALQPAEGDRVEAVA